MALSIRYILVSLTFLLLVGCAEEENDRSQKALLNKMEDDYLAQIDNMGITELYEEAKWRMYCNHCDVPVKSCSGMELSNITYGMLDLKIFYLKLEDDIGELAFTFIYNDSLQCNLENVSGNKVHGIGFEKSTGRPLYYISAGNTNQISLQCDTMIDINECPTRMLNPDQPVVKKFLQEYRPRLNPWFHMQAVKRGFLQT